MPDMNLPTFLLILPPSLSHTLSLCSLIAEGNKWTELSTQLKVRGQFWLDKTSQSENRKIIGMPTDFDHAMIFPRTVAKNG